MVNTILSEVLPTLKFASVTVTIVNVQKEYGKPDAAYESQPSGRAIALPSGLITRFPRSRRDGAVTPGHVWLFWGIRTNHHSHLSALSSGPTEAPP